MYIPLNVHSHYSLGSGTSSPRELVERAVELGLPALALTDRGTLAGQVQFHQACRQHGIKPITGMEIPVEEGRLVALARDHTGYESLCRMVSRPAESFYEGLLLLSDVPRDLPAGELRMLSSGRVVMARPEDFELQRLLARIQGCPPASRDAYLRATGETWSEEVAARTDFDLLSLPLVLPEPRPELAERCRGRVEPEHGARLEEELAVIEELGLSGYLLLVAEIAAEARRRKIPVACRGSAVGSLVVHLLGISDLDPVRHGLLFERFLHPRRASLPDIDLDFASERREEILAWVHRRFGKSSVAMVGVHQTFQRRSAVREGYKALGVSAARVERIARTIPQEEDLPVPSGLNPLVMRLVGKPRHLSVHPGGVVIAAGLEGRAPLERAPKGVRVTQYDMHSLEQVGLVKIDLLGNRFLSQYEACGAPAIPEDDEATLNLLGRADTVGCFQVESPPVRSVLRRMPMRSLDDVVSALAVVRPGPAAGEAKAAFLRGRKVPLFEEDITRMLADSAGLSLAQADELREAIVSGETPEVCGTPEVWDAAVRFAAYSFNKAHATSYALLAYRAAFLKAHRPLAFACAVLNHYGGMYPLRTVAADFLRHGVPIVAPCVNRSAEPCRLEGQSVRVGLAFVKYLTGAVRRRLLKARPFADLVDLQRRVKMSRRELQALVLCGACDGLAPLLPELYPFAHRAVLEGGPLMVPAEPAELYRRLVRVRHELEFLEMHLSDHPVALLRPEADRLGCATTATAESRVRLVALVAASRRVVTPAGVMQYVTFEDEHGLLEAGLSPAVYARLDNPVVNPGPYLVEGHVQREAGEPRLRVTGLSPFYRRGQAD